MGRTLLISHRLPFSASIKDNEYKLESSVGGLATGLMPLLENKNLWLGWSGSAAPLTNDVQKKLDQDFLEHGCVPIEYPEAEHHAFLTEMCNGVLWPLYHYQVGNLPLQFSGWEDYVEINRITADKIASVAKAGDTIWIQDYHFQLLPKMLRERNLEVKIGFFLHIPFPSFEIFRILPWRKEILKGLLGADLIGFHTSEYVDHFMATAKELLNLEQSGNHLRLVDREVQVDHFPLGVDLSELSKPFAGESPAADALKRVKAEHPELKFLLSVDRLDYTKGLARKLLAFERLLEENSDLRGKLMLIQIAPPSRGDVPAYHEFRRQLDEHVGRINGKFATPAYQPIFYLTRSFHPQEIYQIYKDVDVMLVTPVRDGMNLVAKEFIASREDADGVLVLSEFAGASSELHEALMVNPYDVTQMAKVFKIAVEMPEAERHSRMKSLRERVIHFHTSEWAETILEQIRSMPETLRPQIFAEPKTLAAKIVAEKKPIKIALDYDGTLYPIVRIPATAIPDYELRQIIGALAKVSEVNIVSGRPMHELKSWFDGLDVQLHAEHGAISGDKPSAIGPIEIDTFNRLAESALRITRKYPGCRIERKQFSCCFHYRAAEEAIGIKASEEFKKLVANDFHSLEIMDGKKAVEARFPHLNKGIVVRQLAEGEEDVCIVAIGDDRTDEDMFDALPESGYSVVIGGHPSHARYRLRDSEDVRLLLLEIGVLLKSSKELRPIASLEKKHRAR